MLKKIASILTLISVFAIASSPVAILNGGLIALSNPDKVVKDYALYQTGQELPKEDQAVIEQVLEICKANPGFSIKNLSSNEGYIEYKKLLSTYTYTVQEALKQQKKNEG